MESKLKDLIEAQCDDIADNLTRILGYVTAKSEGEWVYERDRIAEEIGDLINKILE